MLRLLGRIAFALVQLIANLVQKYDPDPPESYAPDELIYAANDNVNWNSLSNIFWRET